MEFWYKFLKSCYRKEVTVCSVTVREEAVTFSEEKPKAALTFLSCCVYCFETSFKGNSAMHDAFECFLLY